MNDGGALVPPERLVFAWSCRRGSVAGAGVDGVGVVMRCNVSRGRCCLPLWWLINMVLLLRGE